MPAHGTTCSPRLPHCLQFLADERRWVGWRWEDRKGRRTKPPVIVIGGRPGQYARNDNSSTWAPLVDAIAAAKTGKIDGIGLQLLDVKEFAAIDLDDVRDQATGAILPWVEALVRSSKSYAEVTPSGSGVRVLGRVNAEFPSTHRRACFHPEGGEFEIYANMSTGRYITVSGQCLTVAQDRLSGIDEHLHKLLSIADGARESDASAARMAHAAQEQFTKLPPWVRVS